MSDMIMDVKAKPRTRLSDRVHAENAWPEIIFRLTGHEMPKNPSTHITCPLHGGERDFRFVNDNGKGEWVCTCSNGQFLDGFEFLKRYLGEDFKTVLHRSAECLGLIDGNGLPRKGVFRPVSEAKISPPEDSDDSRQKAINYSRDVVKQCVKTSAHPYLKIKGLDNTSLSFLASKERHELPYIRLGKSKKQTIPQGSLIISIHDLGNISSVIGIQFIPPFVNKETGEHDKFYIANMPLKDGVHIIKGDETKYIAVVEGYATGLSVFLATGYTTVVAFDKNGVKDKAERIQRLYPNKELVFFADNDEGGIKAASEASKLVAGKVVLPPEAGDWNDFHIKHGLELTREAINPIIDQGSKIPKVFNQGDRYGFIDLFTPIQIITDDGVITAPMIEAINNYQDQKCFCPITGNKSYIKSFCIYRPSDKFVLRPTASNCHDEETYLKFKGISNQRRLAKVRTKEDILAVLLLNSSRMGEQFISIEAIKEFIKNHWGELPNSLTLLFQKLIDAKVNKASKLSRSDFSLYGKPLKLKQGSDGRLDWSPALTANQAVLTAVKVTHGQGKTSDYSPNLIKQCNYQRPIYVTHRSRLGGQASNVIGMNDYRDPKVKEAAEIGLLDDLAVCIHSLTNLNYANQLAHSGLIIIDEASQLLRAIVKDQNLEKEAVNNFISRTKVALEKGAKIVLLDADLNQGDIERFQKLFGISTSDVRVIEAEIPDRNYSAHIYPNAGNNHKNSCLLKPIKEDIKNNIPIVIGCEGMNTAMAITSILGNLFPKKKEKIKLITSSTVSSEEAKGESVIENIESNSLKWDVVIYTNVIGTGVSIEHKSPRFKKGYFLFTGSVLTPYEWPQMMRRFRDVKEFHVEVYIKPLYARMVSFYKNLGRDEFEKEASEDALFALGLDIRHESAQFGDLSIPLFIHLLKHHKFTVHGELAKLGEKLPIKEVKEDKNQAIYNARILTGSEYERLKRQESSGLSIEDQNAVERHEIAVYFKREITIDDVSLYKNHSARRKLDNFLMLTRKELLDEKTVSVLEESGLIKILEEALVSPVAIGENRKNELNKSLKKTLKKLKALGIAPENLCKDLKCRTTFIKNIFKEFGFKVGEPKQVRVGNEKEYQLTIKAPELLYKRLNINGDTYGINPDKQAKEDNREAVLRLYENGHGYKKIVKITGISESKVKTIIKNK